MRDYETLTKAVMILPKGEPIYGEMVTTVALDDEAGGLFVRVTQEPGTGTQSITINAEEWPLIRAAIDAAVQTCLERNQGQP